MADRPVNSSLTRRPVVVWEVWVRWVVWVMSIVAGLLMSGMVAGIKAYAAEGAPSSGWRMVQGQLIQGGYLIGQVEPGMSITHGGRQISVGPKGHFFIGFGRDAVADQELEFRAENGVVRTHNLAIASREYVIQSIEGVPARTVNPDPEHLERIKQEAALVKAARSLDEPRQDFLESFTWPVEGPITGVYGSQRIYNGEPRSPHYGLDIAAPNGTLVRAPASGRVTLVHEEMFFSGGTLILDHGQGFSSTFIHLDAVLVSPGDDIAQGDPIARVGATGRATGPHLDWRMNWFGERLDPALWVSPVEGTK